MSGKQKTVYATSADIKDVKLPSQDRKGLDFDTTIDDRIYEPGTIIEFEHFDDGKENWIVGRILSVYDGSYYVTNSDEAQGWNVFHDQTIHLHGASLGGSRIPMKTMIPIGSRVEYVYNGTWKPAVIYKQHIDAAGRKLYGLDEPYGIRKSELFEINQVRKV